MQRLTLIWISLLLLHAAVAQSNYWQQQADYNISVTLNDEQHTLDGFETIIYHNNSPDPLTFLWIHVWPNAYKNDRTAYSEQKLLQQDTHFYFSGNEDKGYINHLDFKINGSSLVTDDHPQYIDIIKLILPKALAPHDSVIIETPFHVKIPTRFSRLGHDKQNYSFTQWYPKVAMYDKTGWHEMPYLEWGEYYNDFGNYRVNITLPANYIVAATGTLQNEVELAWLRNHDIASLTPVKTTGKKKDMFPAKRTNEASRSLKQTKKLQYSADNVTDFAWFADKDFIVKYDTIQLQNRVIDAWNFVLPDEELKWKNSMAFTKKAIRFYSVQVGDYPFPQVSVVGDPRRAYEGMEYPMISILNMGDDTERDLDVVITHEIGHNWFQEALATNERDHPWMDEGMNTYIENKYRRYYYGIELHNSSLREKKLPADATIFLLNKLYSTHTDQQMDGSADKYSFESYNASAYFKPAMWMEKLEREIGGDSMLRLMHNYYSTWQFRHPYPEDFKAFAEANTGRSLDDHFDLLYTTGPLEKPTNRKLALTGFFNVHNSVTKQYISFAPAMGFNNYDKFQIGLTIHNYNLPANKFQFVTTPMFATGSKQLVGYTRASYDIFPKKQFQKIQLYTAAARFNTDKGVGLNNENVFKNFSKLTPGIYFEWKKKKAISPITKWADIRTFIISEQTLEQKPKPAPADTEYYSALNKSVAVIPQISFGIKSERELYPWSVALQLQQVKQIVRSSITANYFLNYNEQHEGLAVRFFFGKIFYTQTRTDLLRSQNSRYHFTMYAPNGEQDYTYSSPFAERNQSTGLFGRQITMRDGGFKYRSDYSAIQPGLNSNKLDFFDNWIAATNFTVDIPSKINPFSILPFDVPLKVFADVGTSASPWRAGSNASKFLYSMGLQLPLFKIINIYYPLLQSKAFKEPNSVNDPFKSGGPNWWQKRLTFSIDLAPLKNKAETLFVL